MEYSETKNTDSALCVAINIRPLITSELGCTSCISVVEGKPKVQIGQHIFTYDHIFGNMGSPSASMYDDCISPLMDALLCGYNATILAYGQTGSGKTYTMGTNYTEGSSSGIIPRVIENILEKVQATKENTKFQISISFIEIFKEEVFDLLDHGHARVPLQIIETANGGVTTPGLTGAEVRKKEDMTSYLIRGSSSRATGSTNMNTQSSRSHAIFTITLEQDIGDDIL